MSSFTEGSLYLAGFAQVGDPHAGLALSIDSQTSYFSHIKIENDVWTRQTMRQQKLTGSLTLTTLLKIHDISAGAITKQQLQDASAKVEVPSGGENGECLKWVISVVQALHDDGLLKLSSGENLALEFSEFAAGNRGHASRRVFPNVKASAYCE